MTRAVTVTEWACDREHCGHTARVESVGGDPVPLPEGWRRKQAPDPQSYRLLDLCPRHA